MVIAEREGLLRGERTQMVRGRMPEALVTIRELRKRGVGKGGEAHWDQFRHGPH